MMFFSYLSSVTLADSEKNYRVSYFTTTYLPTVDTTTPGERQKLITFPLTAKQSHLLIFSSPAVRRQRGQERKQGKINIMRNRLRLRDEWHFGVQKITIEANNNNDRAARWLESPSLRRACPSFQNSSLWAIVPLNGEP